MWLQLTRKSFFTQNLTAPVLTVLGATSMVLLHALWPVAQLFWPPVNWGGLLLLGAGLAICLTAHRQFKQIGANLYPFKDPAHLVTEGLFHYSRNPMYLGLTLFLAGLGMVLGSLAPLGIVALFFLIADRWYIAYEEQRLTHVFGAAYTAYQAHTRRWL